MRFLIDEDLCKCLAVYLRHCGHDAVAVCKTGRDDLRQTPDDRILEIAAQERRITVTINERDFRDLHRACQDEGRGHAGIVISPERGHADFESVLGWMDSLLADVPQTGFANRLHYLSAYMR
jgi:hypothetical protein